LKKDAHPKTQSYWLGIQNGIALIDPEKMLTQIESLKTKIQKIKSFGKEILVVCTKSLYSQRLAELAQKQKFHYLDYKVLSGFLTNFETLIERIASMNKMKEFIDTDAFQRMTKKEQLMMRRSYAKVEKIYKGVQHLSKKPDFVIVIDAHLMRPFVKEIEKVRLDNLLIASTNFNQWWDNDRLLVMNNNSYSSLDLVLTYLLS
jgi:ribosomal protein S2